MDIKLCNSPIYMYVCVPSLLLIFVHFRKWKTAISAGLCLTSSLHFVAHIQRVELKMVVQCALIGVIIDRSKILVIVTLRYCCCHTLIGTLDCLQLVT